MRNLTFDDVIHHVSLTIGIWRIHLEFNIPRDKKQLKFILFPISMHSINYFRGPRDYSSRKPRKRKIVVDTNALMWSRHDFPREPRKDLFCICFKSLLLQVKVVFFFTVRVILRWKNGFCYLTFLKFYHHNRNWLLTYLNPFIK